MSTPYALLRIDAGAPLVVTLDVTDTAGEPVDLEDVDASLTVYAGDGETVDLLVTTGTADGELVFTASAEDKDGWPLGRLPFTVDTDDHGRLMNGTFDHREPHRD